MSSDLFDGFHHRGRMFHRTHFEMFFQETFFRLLFTDDVQRTTFLFLWTIGRHVNVDEPSLHVLSTTQRAIHNPFCAIVCDQFVIREIGHAERATLVQARVFDVCLVVLQLCHGGTFAAFNFCKKTLGFEMVVMTFENSVPTAFENTLCTQVENLSFQHLVQF